MNITVFIGMNIVTLTFLTKVTVPMHANLVFKFFYSSDKYDKWLNLVFASLFF